MFFVRVNWEDPNSEVMVYRFRVVLFGSTSSPFFAEYHHLTSV